MYGVCGCLVETVFQAKIGHCVCQAWGYLMVVKMPVQTCCCLCQTWSSLARDTEHTEDSHCLFGVCALLVWGLCTLVGWGEVSRNHPGWTIVLARLMESSDLVPTCAGLAGCGEGSTKEQWHLPALLTLGESCPNPCPSSAFPEASHLVSLCMSLVLFELLFLHCAHVSK